ncbi:MAG: AAA family ATPase [Deltaproteobacteria bacterium RIFCSPLOWO2_12_FULL_40_28]|nr:MAG: AAA family ATPase [Deltaproteobacteria bacterium RIFCSPHIGHO2_02_FULL_40_28]OGQ18884.1 MAG: AAA family ATPase [Deltaproteobacteria bacterium RIFCSPHIGHO2_12_FULL_40_32]OGQ40129.1 MAG: AAA family ATPase [Deltaproteobacteria bacterium RIFCSPLOWO2_02_FULL_40_36]OGQ53312.1 MAG: AAA family ATPase [Deltaproteobacteria bacterium RIFCSPLOWO2_12_FULL_40_28]
MGKIIRYLSKPVTRDLRKKMVFISGPRQVGKTTFALSFLKGTQAGHLAYLSWDNVHDRDKIKTAELPSKQPVVIFDEVHKFARWRSLVKGLYDKYHNSTRFIVTGSARLDYFSKGGDSLFGRYYHYRLHPFSLAEISKNPTLDHAFHLLQFGGFPEPYLSASEITLKRWQKERKQKIIYDDLRDLTLVKETSLLDLLVDALPARIGSPLSIKNLAEDLQVNHKTMERWLSILERLYISFRIAPFGSPKIRAVKKEQKLYLWDWSACENEGARFENMVACQLLKYCHFQEDVFGDSMELRYLRDTDKREVDFVVLKNKKAVFAVECRLSDTNLSPHIHYFSARTDIPKFYQVHLKEKDFGNETTIGRSLPLTHFVKELGLP